MTTQDINDLLTIAKDKLLKSLLESNKLSFLDKIASNSLQATVINAIFSELVSDLNILLEDGSKSRAPLDMDTDTLIIDDSSAGIVIEEVSEE